MSDNSNNPQNGSPKNGLSRRDALKGLATVPLVGGLFYGAAVNAKTDKTNKKARQDLIKEFNINERSEDAAMDFKPGRKLGGQTVKLGIIGFGIRGKQLMRASGFATKDWIEGQRKLGDENPRLKSFYEQEDLNVEFRAVCDIFSVYNDMALDSASQTRDGKKIDVKKYHAWEDLIADPEIDGVIIATPDHWHAPMAIAAAKAGKHVYVEKPMTHQIQETHSSYPSHR